MKSGNRPRKVPRKEDQRSENNRWSKGTKTLGTRLANGISQLVMKQNFADVCHSNTRKIMIRQRKEDILVEKSSICDSVIVDQDQHTNSLQ